MKKFFFLFLFLIILPAVFSINDWRNYHYDTLQSSNPLTTFARYDTGIQTIYSSTLGTGNLGSPYYIKEFIYNYMQTRIINTFNNTYFIIPASDNITRIYDKNLNIKASYISDGINGEITVTDFYSISSDNLKIDIFMLEQDGLTTYSNMSWLRFDGNNITKIYSEQFGQDSFGITCTDFSGNFYCAWALRNIYNQTSFFKATINEEANNYILKLIDLGTETNLLNVNTMCYAIPALLDFNFDGNLEAIFCSNIVDTNLDDIIVVDMIDENLENTFSNDGVLNDLGVLTTDVMLVNIDGSADNLQEIIIGERTSDIINIISASGGLRYEYNVEASCDGAIKSIARTDINNDAKFDILVWCMANNVQYSLFATDGINILLDFHDLNSLWGDCGGTGARVSSISVADLDNTMTYINAMGVATPCGVGIMQNNGSIISIIDFSSWQETKPIIADVTHDNFYEIIMSKEGNTTIFSSQYINLPVNFNNYEINTGTPVCLEETVTFICYGFDNDGEMINCGIDVYGNGSIEWGSFTRYSDYAVTQHTFLTSEIGYAFNNMKIFMSDEGHPYNEEINYEIPVTYQVEDSVVCHHAGEGGFEETINETGGFIDGEPVTDFSDFVNSILTLTGMNSTIGKGIIVLFLLIMSIVGLSRVGNVPSEAYIIILITELGLFAWLEFLPAWLIILMIIVASAFIVWLFRQPTGVAK